jgi:hypothetical protein
MEREIETLLTTYLADRNKETRVVNELLTVPAVGSAKRKRMLRQLTAAVGGSRQCGVTQVFGNQLDSSF